MSDSKCWHYEQRVSGKKECPKCSKNMITEFLSHVMSSNPPQQRWRWFCGCGYEELGGIHVHKTEEEMRLEKWRRAND